MTRLIPMIGVMLQLVGLAVDAWLHARDATLAAREGVFTLSNPGHLLFLLGLGITATGVCVALLDLALDRRPGGGGALIRLSSTAAVLALAGAVVAVSSQHGDQHLPPVVDATVDAAGHHHDGLNVSWEQLRDIDATLTQTKAATEKYRDVTIAQADGYLQGSIVHAGGGAHFYHTGILNKGVFDPVRPGFLLYDEIPAGGFELVGVGWKLPRKVGDAQPSFFTPLLDWHTHEGERDICRIPRTEDIIVQVWSSEAECRQVGGAFVGEPSWTAHVWLFRPGPEGLFSALNSTIGGEAPAFWLGVADWKERRGR